MTFAEAARTVSTETNVPAGIADAAYVAADPKRVAIWLSGFVGVRVTYSTLGAAVLDQGITIPAGVGGLWLTFADHGPLVGKAWRSIASGAVAGGVNAITIARAE